MRLYSTVLYMGMILLLALFMVINPAQSVQAASDGIKLWGSVVLPALLPFFIVAELLVSMRFAHILGAILEPLMRPLFHLPGCSALVIVMGFTSGFPIGAVLTRKLYEENLLRPNEAERLVSFTNNSSPLFILGAVGVGLLGNPSAGYILAFSHYLSNLAVGLLWRFKADPESRLNSEKHPGLYEARTQLIKVSQEIHIGKTMGDAIKNSLNNILAVGGFIVLFSVLTRMLSLWGFMDGLASFLAHGLSSFNLSYPLAYALSMGFFEMTLGTKTVCSSNAPLLAQLTVISSILAFSGLSILAQISSIVSGLPIRFSFYIFSRLVQVILACLITWLSWKWSLFSCWTMEAASLPIYKVLYSVHAWQFSLYCMLAGLMLIVFMTILARAMQNR